MKLGVLKESKLLARHSLIYGLGIFLNQAVALLLLPIYTHYLSVNDYGVKELISITMNIISMLTTTAVSAAVFRFYFDSEDAKEKDSVIGTAIISIMIIGGLILGSVLLISPMLGQLVLNSREQSFLFNIAATSLCAQTVNGVSLDYLRANRKSLHFIIVSSFSLLTQVGLNIFFIVYLGKGVTGIFISTLIASILMFAYLTLPIIVKVRFRFSLKKLKAMLKFGLPMVPSSIGAFVVHSSDRFFIKAFCSVGDAGLYSLGYRFGILPGTFVSQPFNQVWMPRRLEVYKEPNAEVVFGRIFTYFLFLIVFFGLGISVLSETILMIISAPEFWKAYKVVPIIVLANIIFTMHYHFNMGIVISKKTKYFAFINFSNGCLVLMLNTVLIKYFGVFGAAYATLFAFVYKVVLTYYFSNRLYKIYFEGKRILKIAIVAALLFFLCHCIEIKNIYLDGGLKLVTILFYPLILLLIQFFTDEEKAKVSAIARKLRLAKIISPTGSIR